MKSRSGLAECYMSRKRKQEKQSKPEKMKKQGKPETQGKPEKSEKQKKPEKQNKPEKSEKQKKPEKPEKQKKSKKPEKKEKTEKHRKKKKLKAGKSKNKKVIPETDKLQSNDIPSGAERTKVLLPDEKLAELFRIFGDESRLKILELLKEKELSAGDLLQSLDIAQSTLSHHMKVLTEAGVVICRKQGKWSMYSINHGRLAEISESIMKWS